MINMPIRTVVFPGHFGSELLFKMAHKLIEGISNDRFPGTGSLHAFCQRTVDSSGNIIANLSFRCGSLPAALDFAVFSCEFGVVSFPSSSYLTFSFWMVFCPSCGTIVFLFKVFNSVFSSGSTFLFPVAFSPFANIFTMAKLAFSPETIRPFAFMEFRKWLKLFTFRTSSFLKGNHINFVIQIND